MNIASLFETIRQGIVEVMADCFTIAAENRSNNHPQGEGP